MLFSDRGRILVFAEGNQSVFFEGQGDGFNLPGGGGRTWLLSSLIFYLVLLEYFWTLCRNRDAIS